MIGLTQVQATGWDDVRTIRMDDWLWLDMTQGGLHRGPLPDVQPSQLSHVWGWSCARLLRIRFDPNLPHGIAGAEISLQDAGEPREVLLWHNRSGKIRMEGSGFHSPDGAASVKLHEFVVPVTSRDEHGLVRMPITFYRIIGG